MDPINFKQSYELAACGLITFRNNGSIVHANETLLGWLDSGKEKVLEMKFTELLYKGKLYYNLFVQPLLQMHGKVDEINLEIQTVKGYFPALFSAVVQKSIDGKEEIIHGTIFKIADRKKYETEILKEKKKFERKNSIKKKALLDIAFSQAHLIRAPLANILGLINLLEEDDLNNMAVINMLKESALNLDTVVREIVLLSNTDENQAQNHSLTED